MTCKIFVKDTGAFLNGSPVFKSMAFQALKLKSFVTLVYVKLVLDFKVFKK